MINLQESLSESIMICSDRDLGTNRGLTHCIFFDVDATEELTIPLSRYSDTEDH